MNIYPRRITSIHQVEMTSLCNLRCQYCVHPKMIRPKMDMADETWQEVLHWVSYFIEQGTQGTELNLAGIGESTMHPRFVDYVHQARETIGWERQLILATNGLLMTDEMAAAISPAKPRVWVSLHRPEKGGPAVEALRRAGIYAGVSVDASVNAINWAEQVDWHVSAEPEHCKCLWLPEGRVMIMSDGHVGTCCLDGSGEGIIGSIKGDLRKLVTQPYELCKTCHMAKSLNLDS